MNYDHRFHAGNFADVFKHVVLTRILLYLKRKASPFRVIETHAGRGAYDLKGEAPGRSSEWQTGVGRLDVAALSPEAAGLFTPYLEIVGDATEGKAPYQGSPCISRLLTRPADRMIFCELHPAAAGALKTCVRGDRRVKIIEIDGYVGLNAFIPPRERRGLVLIDPPFEMSNEFDRLSDALLSAHAKWRDGIFMIWYPIKDRRGVECLSANIAQAGIPDVLRFELDVDRPRKDGALVSSGLVVINPPYALEGEMACLLPALQRLLSGERGAWRIDRLASE